MSTINSEYKLTQFSRGAGCGCKIAPQVLSEILKDQVSAIQDKKLLVGNAGNEDASVYDLGNGTALISTTDFFMPVVDGAFEFGQIAAANAISDVYAMGGTPAFALAILGWPIEKLQASLAAEVMKGAKATCEKAGIVIAGGHSVDSAEPLFGLAVNGFVDLKHLKRNSGAKEGDLIFLTKGIGSGILSTAMKRGLLKEEHQQDFIAELCSLNDLGKKLGALDAITAMTDVTGFGVLGHLLEMMKAANLSAEIELKKLPLLKHVKDYLDQNIFPDASFRNWNAYQNDLQVEKSADSALAFKLLPDPQTNGGLLFTVRPAAVKEVQELLRKEGYAEHAEPIGSVRAKAEKALRVM